MSDQSPHAPESLPAPASRDAEPRKAQDAHRGGFLETWREGWFGVFLLLIIAAALGALIARLWPGPEGSALSPSADTTDRIATLEARVLSLAAEGSNTAVGDIAALRTRLTQIEDRVRAAEAILAAMPVLKPAPAAGDQAQVAPAPATAPAAQPAPAGTADMAALSTRLDGLGAALAEAGTRIAAVEAKAAEPQKALPLPMTLQVDLQALRDQGRASSETLQSFNQRLEEMTAKLGALPDPAPAIQAVRSDVDLVSARVAKIEQTDLQGTARRAGLAASVASLSRAAQTDAPFRAELDVVAALSPGDPALADLLALADRGVPMPSQLSAAFPAVADRALAAERAAQKSSGFEGVWNAVSGIVSVRPTGDVAGDGLGARLARAETKLKSGQLRQTYDELSLISGPAKPVLAPWLASAANRMKLDAALTSLNTRVVQSLTQSTAL